MRVRALRRQGHQRHGRVALVLVRIGNERGVVYEVAQALAFLLVVIDRRIDELGGMSPVRATGVTQALPLATV